MTKGNKVKPGDNLVKDVDNPTAQIPTKPTVSISCPSYTFETTYQMMEWAKQIDPSGVRALPLGVAVSTIFGTVFFISSPPHTFFSKGVALRL